MCENKEESLRKRILEAKKYQKMAIGALFSEEQREHMDVIGKEMKTVLVNGLLDVLEETGTMDRVMQYAMDYFFETAKNNGADAESRNGEESNGNAKGNSNNKGIGYKESCEQTKDHIEKEGSNKKSSVRKVMVGS